MSRWTSFSTPRRARPGALQIARAIRGHKGKVTVFVPHYAMSGGTLIALAADEIVMSRHAVLGPIDLRSGSLRQLRCSLLWIRNPSPRSTTRR